MSTLQQNLPDTKPAAEHPLWYVLAVGAGAVLVLALVFVRTGHVPYLL